MTEATDVAASPVPARPAAPAAGVAVATIEALRRLLVEHAPVTVLCGAGCSTASGIPDYRDADGAWKQRQPMQFAEFMSGLPSRRRYWARSMVGWPRFRAARPNATHHALVELERRGYVQALITQNVDDLHRRAGQRRVIDLHGRLADVVCTACGASEPRDDFQQRMMAINVEYRRRVADRHGRHVATVADGDAAVESGYDELAVADCACCGGVLKPDVVFFGEAVPPPRVARAYAAVEAGGALLVVGSSLMVYSGYRFARAAKAAGKPLAIVNRGRTRADAEADLKIEHDCAAVLDALVRRLPLR